MYILLEALRGHLDELIQDVRNKEHSEVLRLHYWQILGDICESWNSSQLSSIDYDSLSDDECDSLRYSIPLIDERFRLLGDLFLPEPLKDD